MRNYQIRSSAGLFVLWCLVASAFQGCAQSTAREGKTGVNENMVDCLVPGQIRQLDDRTTFPTQRQVIRVTREECRSRGGEEQSPP
jgi:hypothetical protein